VYWEFVRWEQARATEKILPVVRAQLSLQAGRDAEPSAGLIDSQSVKGADTVGRDTRGYDAGKKINGRKRFIVIDTLGLLLVVVVCAASMQGRNGAKPVLLDCHLRTRVRFVFAGGGFAGRLSRSCAKPTASADSPVIPRRWAVKRTLSGCLHSAGWPATTNATPRSPRP
jgi:hypothetical protein